MIRALVLFVILVVAAPAPADAAWVKPNKKKVTAAQGFRDSANGAVQAVLPWNWFGDGGEEPVGYEAYRAKRRAAMARERR